ncbi:MAG: PilZ domain-containing protein [Terriglobales bacterium]
MHKGNLFRIAPPLEDKGVRPTGAALFAMPQKLMDVLMLGRCAHQFSWPRRAANGEYYQICILCAAAFEYDWKGMRRGDRVSQPEAETTPARRRRSGENHPAWKPRARRVHLKIPVRYRGKNLSTWYAGVIQDISQSGILFHGPQQLPANSMVELIFQMPEEISGQRNSNVLCEGKLIRIKDAVSNAENAFGFAASILDYKFLNQD